MTTPILQNKEFENGVISNRIHIRDDDDAAEFAVVVEDGGLLLDHLFGKGDGVAIFGEFKEEFHEELVANAGDDGFGGADEVFAEFSFEVVGEEMCGIMYDVLVFVPEGDHNDP